MRIGIDVTSALTQGGGIGRYTRELVQAVVTADSESTYKLFSAKRPLTLPVPDPLPIAPNVHYCPAPIGERWLYRLWYRARLPLPVQWVTGDLDLFHSPDFVLPPVKGHIPTLLTVHDLSFVHYPDNYPPALVAYLNKTVPWSVQRATHILADSFATKADLVEIWGVASDKITVLYSGVNGRFQPITDADEQKLMREKYGLGERPYLLAVGTIQPRKNYQLLIRAFARVAGEIPHNLAIAGGKGWLYDDMLAEIERQGVDGRVQFIGFVDDADLPTLYSAASALAFPSVYEGFGLPLLEAMACGTPVITSNVSSLPEVAGTAAVQLDPHDEPAWAEAIQHMLTDPALRTRLVAAGFRQARTFSWQKSAQQLLDIYRRLAAVQE